MKQICVIAKNKETYFIKRLIEEVGESFSLFDPWSDFELPAADYYLARTTGVYGNDLDLLILKSLDQKKVINPHDVLKIFRDKSKQYEWFEHKNLPILPWLNLKTVDLLNVEKFFRLYPEVVVKPLMGQGGWGLEALTWESFKSWKKKRAQDDSYLIQPFIKNAIEYRYFFMQGCAPIILKREAKTGIAANFKKEGSARVSGLDDKFQPIIQEAISMSGALYGAFDLLVDDDRLYILELNVVPGIEQLEKVTGSNVMKSFLQAFS